MPASEEVVALVRRWLEISADHAEPPAAARLAAMLRDPAGLPFTVGFIDHVIRPEDPHVAATNLRRLARRPPGFLPLGLRLALQAGAVAAAAAPRLVVPIVKRVLRAMVSHLVIDATDRRLTRTIAKLRDDGSRLNLNLLGEAVLGRGEADRRLQRTLKLLERDDVDYVSIKVSAGVPPHSPWAFEETVTTVCERLLPLFRTAAGANPPKFINLDMEEYRDLDLTIAVFTRLLERPDLAGLEAGIVLQAYLPDALGAMMRLQDWAAGRRRRGGAPIKVRLVKGANLPMERVDATIHGWPLATWPTKLETDANYKRVLLYALSPERARNVRLGIAGHNLFDIAFAWLLAGEREVRDAVDFEMLLGMASGHAHAVGQTVGPLRLYTPVVHPAEFDVAIAYLVRRLEEGASDENFLSAAFGMADDEELFEREHRRYLESLELVRGEAGATVPAPTRRDAVRRDDGLRLGTTSGRHARESTNGAFANAPDSDPSLASHRRWAYGILGRVPDSTIGAASVAAARVITRAELDAAIADTEQAGRRWGALEATERASLLRRAASELERRRGELIEVMAAECGKTLDQADVEVSEAVDFARYYAGLAAELPQLDGAAPVPVPVSLVTPPWNFPVSIPAGCVLGALAAGSAVLLKPAPQAPRCAAVLTEALIAAGIKDGQLRLIDVDEQQLGRELISDPRIRRVILTGAYETATLFRSFRPELPLLAETSGKNAIVVTPSADLDLAVRDIVGSAFGNAGQKCSAASLAILVGSVAHSRRFRRQLVDAVSSLRVAHPTDPTAQMGPLIAPASGKLRYALGELEPGESWLVAPRRLDDSGRLWSPGVREGILPGAPFHLTEYFGPVLGLMVAADLEEAIELQNAVEFGLTAGLHSLDPREVASWLVRVHAGNLYVNRGITGAIVRRQPFGGWKRSAVGPGTKAGGPNYLLPLTDWVARPSTATAPLGPLAERTLKVAGAVGCDVDWLERALRSDAAAIADEYGLERDVSALRVERNLLRYRPVPVAVRSVDGELGPLLRVLAAGAVAGSDVRVSLPVKLPEPVSVLVGGWGFPVAVESQDRWLQGIAAEASGRIRLIGSREDSDAAAAACRGRVDVCFHDQPVTESGRLELLPFLHEQAISITAHRFGTLLPEFS